jgi:isoleucyl-tRNA synthetase
MLEKKDPRPDFPALEARIMRLWAEKDITALYLRKNQEAKETFSFLDGPITANGPMGVHHAWGRTLKDLFQRYHTMKGRAQRYQNGFDCQGLWVEVQVEKELGLRTKRDIENLVPGDEYASLAKFVELCKDRVRHFAALQTEQSKRLGYWMDWGHSYYTMADHNNYAIWGFLRTCHERGWVYQGRDSVPWCPRCGTAISQHEILTEEYHELTHTAVYIALPLQDSDENLLIWTTTPWTLPANMFVAVHPELEYALVEHEGKKVWIAASRAGQLSSAPKVIRKASGSELVGKTYRGPFDDLPVYADLAREHFHEVLAAPDLVSEEEGTGLVHIAPSAGGEDYRLVEKEYGYHDYVIPAVDESGNYLEGYGELVGQNAAEDPDLILSRLGDFLLKTEDYTHRYPVCWRCKTELIWRVVDEWYIAMDREDPTDEKKRTFREQMMDAAREAAWIPAWGLERELDWLRNMHDWMISKKRYWGLALPIYPCECGELTVIGSRHELRDKAASGWEKFDGHSPHRPWVDEVRITCPKCGKPVERVGDVGNPWLDAGIVSLSTLAFPPERFGPDGNLTAGSDQPDPAYLERWFPADFVVEGFPGQFKNWFYALLAMSTGLKRTAPFKTLLGHGHIRDEHGEEMHKSKGNSIEFNEAAEKIGADAMRWLFASTPPEHNVNFGYGPAEEVQRQVFMPLWNSYNYLATYAGEEFRPSSELDSQHVLDRWLTQRLAETAKTVDQALGNFDAPTATRSIQALIEDLSTWYIRRSRKRFSESADPVDRQAATEHLYRALLITSSLMAPFTPFLAEELYQGLPRLDSEAPDSVHLIDFPLLEAGNELLEPMRNLREIVSLALAQRMGAGVKVRQPLQGALLNMEPLPQDLEEILKEEINVLRLDYGESLPGTDTVLKVTLNTEITPELEKAGLLRELVRAVQNARKVEGFEVADRVRITLGTEDELLKDVIEGGREVLQTELRASEIVLGGASDKPVRVNGREVTIRLDRA